MLPAKDISRWNGVWQETGEPIVMIKMSGGDDGLYMDSQAAANYTAARAANKAVGGYHFAGWTNPAAEANYFMQAMSPLAENDVYALDIESIPAGADPVAWSQTFVQTIHDRINVWPLVYMNLSTLNAYDWSPVLQNCGLWLADWNNDPSATIPTVHTYVMQQYSDGPNYDHDEWFGTLDEFNKYGYHTPNPPVIVNQPLAPVAPTPIATATGASTTQDTVNVTTQPPIVVGPQVTKKGNSMNLGKYNKTIVAVAGFVVTFLVQHYAGNAAVNDLIVALTAAGVHLVPNKPAQS